MSGKPDLSNIQRPEDSPPEQPDDRSRAETRDLAQKKGLSPTARADAAHEAHITGLYQRIEFHDGQCKDLQTVVENLRAQLQDRERELRNLSVRYERLEAVSAVSGAFFIIGNALTIIGSGVLGVAGAMPTLSDILRVGLVVGGAVAVISGFMISTGSQLMAHLKGPRDQE